MQDFEIPDSNRVRMDRNMPGQILTLCYDHPIFQPAEPVHHPAQTNLAGTAPTVFPEPNLPISRQR